MQCTEVQEPRVAARLLLVDDDRLVLGTLAAVQRGSWLDRAIVALSVAGVSMPVFFVGLVLIQYVGYVWDLLPFTGRTGPVWAGGLPALMKRIEAHLHMDAPTVTGKTVGQNIEGARVYNDDVIRPLDKPMVARPDAADTSAEDDVDAWLAAQASRLGDC